jgi:hypothetical protein
MDLNRSRAGLSGLETACAMNTHDDHTHSAEPPPGGKLLAQVLAFNEVTAECVHPSWLHDHEMFWREHVQAFQQPEARQRASAWLRDHFGLNGCYDENFNPQPKRVYLIDLQAFQRLALWLGASLAVAQLRQQLMRPQVLSLRSTYGESGLRQLLSSFTPGCDTGLMVFFSGDAAQPEQLYTLGTHALLAGAHAHGEALLRRTQLKLQRDCVQVEEPMVVLQDAGLLHQHILTTAMTFLPEWNELFAHADEAFPA